MKLLIAIFLAVGLKDSQESEFFAPSGIPFNLPNTRYCHNCDMSRIRWPREESVFGSDGACLYFMYNALQNDVELNANLIRLYQELQQVGSNHSWVLLAYIKAKQNYEDAFRLPYTLEVMVEPDEDPEAENCIHMHVQGSGFAEALHLRVVQPGELITQGEMWETLLVDGLRDIWAVTTCNRTFHKEFVEGANRRVNDHLRRFRHWSLDVMDTGGMMYHNYDSAMEYSPCGMSASKVPDRIKKVSCTTLYCPQTPSTSSVCPAKSNDGVGQASTDYQIKTGSTTKDAPSVQATDPVYLINEFAAAKTQRENNEFIEIRVHPPEEHILKSLKVVAFSTLTMRVVTVVSIHNVKTNRNGLLAIFPNQVLPGVNVLVSNDQENLNPFSLLPSGEVEPIVVLLLKKLAVSSLEWEYITLQKGKDGKRHSLDVSYPTGRKIINRAEILEKSVIDSLIYGRQMNKAVTPEVIRLLKHPQRKLCNFILPFSDPEIIADRDLSTNLCIPEDNPIVPFQFSHFKRGSRTPGSPNDCQMDRPSLVDTTEHYSDNKYTVGVTNFPKLEAACPIKNDEVEKISRQISTEFTYLQTNVRADYFSPYYPLSRFEDVAWPQVLTSGHVNLNDIDLSPYEVVKQRKRPFPAETTTAQSTEDASLHSVKVRCQVCTRRRRRSPESFPGHRCKTGLTKETGIELPTSAVALKNLLLDHIDSTVHLTSVFYELRQERTSFLADKRKRYKHSKSEELKQLANVLDVTYTLVITNTSPVQSPMWYRTLRKIDANLGSLLHSRTTAFRMIDFIATRGSYYILTYLQSRDVPIAIILDGSSDRSNKHYVLVYVQALEGERTIPYFLFLLRLKTAFTAEAYLQELQEEIRKRGSWFEEYFKRNLVAVITDSAPTMGKFHKLLSQWVNRKDYLGKPINLVSIFCLAHRLQLVTRSSIIPLKSDTDHGERNCLLYFEKIEKFMQSIYVWFKIAGRRIGIFRNIMEEDGHPRVELKELHRERWITSEYSTVTSFITTYEVATKALDEILNDRLSTRQVKNEATLHLAQYKDKNFVAALHFLKDFTEAFKNWSTYLQRYSGVLIDQLPFFNTLQESLNLLEGLRGSNLLEFLRDCRCSSRDASQLQPDPCTIEEFEASETVIWQGIILKNNDDESVPLSLLAPELIRKVRIKMAIYVPTGMLDALAVFNPGNFPPGKESLQTQYPALSESDSRRVYGRLGVEYVSKMLGLDTEKTLTDWVTLMYALVDSTTWKRTRVKHISDVFWAECLSDKTLPWTENTRAMIRRIKVLAPGSAVCESGFSIFNIIKNQRRQTLTDDHIESLLKILINGPNNVDDFDSFKYADVWYQAGHMRPEDTNPFTKSIDGPVVDLPEVPTESPMVMGQPMQGEHVDTEALSEDDGRYRSVLMK